MEKVLPYNPKLKELAKKLRKQGILSEVILWSYFKGKQMNGLDFHRQKPIDEYIVDFYCPKIGLVIEIDGASHGNKIMQDEERDIRLKKLGLTVLRVDDSAVKNDIDAVLRLINDVSVKLSQ
ncbi:MAG: DUF559 domain-containing protein [Candidatus Falkowbacteria bacterium]